MKFLGFHSGLRILFFWDINLRRWVIGSQRFIRTNTFTFKSLEAFSLTALTVWYVRYQCWGGTLHPASGYTATPKVEATLSTDVNYQCNYATLGSLIQKHKISELCNQFYIKWHHRLQNAAIQPLSFHEAENYITQYRRNKSDNKITPKYNEPHTSCTKTAEVLGLVIMLRTGRPGNRSSTSGRYPRVKTASGTHPATNRIGTVGSFSLI